MSKIVNKRWGTETWIVNDDNANYCVKRMVVYDGYQSSLHFHDIKDETFYVLSGTLMLNINGVMYRMEENDFRRIKPGSLHRFHSTGGPATFLECSTFHDDDDVVRLEESRKL